MISAASKNVIPIDSAVFHMQKVTNFKLKVCSGHQEIDDIETPHTKSELESYLEDLSRTEARYPHGNETSYVISFVTSMVEEICTKLHEIHIIFQDCYFLRTGSIFEEVKVDRPDEFDFMIILPYLADESNATFMPDEFQFLEWNFVNDRDENEIETFRNIGNILNDVMATIKLPEQWTITTKHFGKYSSRQIAHTFELRFQSDIFSELRIDVDLCFAVPLNKIAIWHGYYGKARKSFLYDTTQKIFYILFERRCRISFSYYEQQIINKFNIDSRPKKLLRLLKVLRSKYISKYFDSNSRTMNSLISTYWLKTIIYHSISNTPCSLCWEKERLDSLVPNHLKKLQSCIKKGELNSFFVPQYNLIYNLSGIKDFPSFGMHSEMFVSDEQTLKREQLLGELDTLITHLIMLREGKSETLQVLKTQEQLLTKENEQLRNHGLRDELLVFLWTYAYNGADDKEALKSIKNFVTDSLPNMEIVGDGYHLVLKEHGKVVDIDQWLINKYETNDDGKPFDYFPNSKSCKK